MDRTSQSLEAVELELREALANLADPFYHAPERLSRLLGLNSPAAAGQLRKSVRCAIQKLRPADDIPKSTRAWRIYDILEARYLAEQTQKETALRLSMTVRHLRREQQLAVRLLAQCLLEEATAAGAVAQSIVPDTLSVATGDEAWRQEVRAEWSRLQEATAGISAGLSSAVGAAISLFNNTASDFNVEWDLASDYIVSCHPSILRQILLIALEKLSLCLQSPGKIFVTAHNAAGMVTVVISGQPMAEGQLPESDFIREILGMHNSDLRVARRNDRLVMEFSLPMVQRQQVLLVDDNPDLVHLYRRYVEGTRYEIVHIDRGEGAVALAEEIRPVSVVLDIMLPDMDGWDLLQTLQNDPATKSIPVVICSVVRREELALALGARALLSKPVRRQEFLATLDRITAV